MLYMDDTLHGGRRPLDVFLMSWKYKHICKSRSQEGDFFSKFRCRRAADNEFSSYVTCHGQLRMRTMTKQTNSQSSLFSFSDLKLPNIFGQGTTLMF